MKTDIPSVLGWRHCRVQVTTPGDAEKNTTACALVSIRTGYPQNGTSITAGAIFLSSTRSVHREVGDEYHTSFAILTSKTEGPWFLVSVLPPLCLPLYSSSANSNVHTPSLSACHQ